MLAIIIGQPYMGENTIYNVVSCIAKHNGWKMVDHNKYKDLKPLADSEKLYVIKEHVFSEKFDSITGGNVKIIMPIRNLFDVAICIKRCCNTTWKHLMYHFPAIHILNMEKWVSKFNESELLVLRFEDFVIDFNLDFVIQKICDFLGFGWDNLMSEPTKSELKNDIRLQEKRRKNLCKHTCNLLPDIEKCKNCNHKQNCKNVKIPNFFMDHVLIVAANWMYRNKYVDLIELEKLFQAV